MAACDLTSRDGVSAPSQEPIGGLEAPGRPSVPPPVRRRVHLVSLHEEAEAADGAERPSVAPVVTASTGAALAANRG